MEEAVPQPFLILCPAHTLPKMSMPGLTSSVNFALTDQYRCMMKEGKTNTL